MNNRTRWNDLVDANEEHVLTLDLDQRNAIADAAQYIRELEAERGTLRVSRAALLAACEAMLSHHLDTGQPLTDTEVQQALDALQKARG